MAKLAKLTGKRWPMIGIRLHEDYPYIEAEVCIITVHAIALKIPYRILILLSKNVVRVVSPIEKQVQG